MAQLPDAFRAPMWPTFPVQAATLSLFAFLVTLPISVWPAAYRLAVPLVTGVGTAALYVDSEVYKSVGFHINGFFFRVVTQPGALKETGVPIWAALAIAAGGVIVIGLEIAAFRWLTARPRWPRRAWAAALSLLVLCTAERFAVATLSWLGGPGVFAAGQVLPLQAPVRMNRTLEKITGRKGDTLPDPFSGAARDAAARLPAGLAPSEVRFTRKPDVLFVVAESLRADFFEPTTMPRLLARSREGATFTNHQSTAPATFYSIFSLLFGLQGHKADAVIGTGRSPVLFGALRENGYQMRFISASSVDWMGLKEGAFGDVKDALETDWEGPFPERDDEMMRRAHRWVDGADDRPMFLFLFFFGTHFDYFYPPRSAVHSPAWDGKGGIKATNAPSELIKNRARNAAYEVDWKLDEFLTWFEAKRGRKPLILFTGDHGEEFREKGRIGHGSGVNAEQIHVPMVVIDDKVPRGSFTAPTSHVDLVPTLFALLGDKHAPELYSDGHVLYESPPDRYVLATVGWEPTYAGIGKDVKVRFAALDAFGRVQITDTFDRPLPDGAARFARAAPAILKMLGKDPGKAAQ
ncbi:MAG TPA: sulfatase-like hydrolase/transferase [Anaeromyxobacteraceae bacterium]|nr:sulfatase-like hydrolase/transferase [Anaeromyxobacteraceae bacterium]